MSDDLTNVPRRLRRFYRHGEPVPEQMKPENNPPHESNVHDEEEPWMKATPPQNASPSPNRSSSRNERRARTNQNPSPASKPSAPASPGLFGRVLSRVNKPSVTPMDHALGLHGKAQFEEKLPRASNEALAQKPTPSSNENSSLPRTAQAQQEIQSALNELRSLAQKDGITKNEDKKTNVSLTSFHFTPAGEAPRAPETSDRTASASIEKTNENVSPRERAEQRRMNKGNTPAATPAASPSAMPVNPSATAPAHIRRRMGQVESSSTLPESARDNMSEGNAQPVEKDDEDFKSLFGENKKKDKKKKKGDDDEDFSLDDAEDGDGELELFEDEK